MSKKIIALILFLFILIILITSSLNCGLPDSTQYEDLNAPTNLTCNKNGDVITINFMGYNYEDNFQGYNIYILDEEDETNPGTTLRNKATNHITLGTDNTLEENLEIRDDYIIKNEGSSTDGEYTPTVKTEDLLIQYNSYHVDDTLIEFYDRTDACYDETHTNIIYDIGEINESADTNDTNTDIDDIICRYKMVPFEFEYTIDRDNIPDSTNWDNTQYTIVVTAYDKDYLQESKPSNAASTSDD